MIILWLFTKGFLWELSFHLNIPSEYFCSLVNCQGVSLLLLQIRCVLPFLWLLCSRTQTGFLGPLLEAAFSGVAWKIKLLKDVFFLLSGCDLCWRNQKYSVWFCGHFPSLSLWGFLRKHSWRRFFSLPWYRLTCCPPTLESRLIPRWWMVLI